MFWKEVISTSDFEPDEVCSVLQAFQPFLKSIDVRTLAVRPQSGEDWVSLVTSIIASARTVEEIRNEHLNLPKLKTSQMELFLSAIPFDYSVFDGFAKGDIGQSWIAVSKGGYTHGIRPIRTRQFNPLDLKMVSKRMTTDGWIWFLSAAGQDTNPVRVRLWDIVQSQSRVAKAHGYSGMEELLKETLRIDDVSHTIDFRLSVFDLPKITKVSFGASSFEVEIETFKGLKDLQLNVNIQRTTNGGRLSTVLKKPFTLADCEEELTGDLCLLKKTIQTPDIFPFDFVEIELIHRNSILTLDQSQSRVPLTHVVEPFYSTLTAFCPLDKFRSMLLKPEDFENAPEKVFENAVAWLLSLAGFHAINLGANSKAIKMNFDVLRKYDKYHVGSADIIAYEDNQSLLLVDCDISGLDETKVRKLIELSEHFEDLSEYDGLEFMPIMFTPKHIDEDRGKRNFGLVDGNLIESILEDLAKGDREQARTRIRHSILGSW